MYFSSSPLLSDPYTNHAPEKNTNLFHTNLFQTTTDQNLDSISSDYDINQDSSHNEYLDTSNEKETFIPLDYFYNIFKIKKNNPYGEDFIIDRTDHKKYFKTTKKTKRGRKSKSKKKGEKKKIHSKKDLDNLLTKIQAHFLNFLINLSNDALKTAFGEDTSYNFKKLPYETKKKVQYEYFHWIKNNTIKDILQMKISEKFKTFDKDANYKTLKEIYGTVDLPNKAGFSGGKLNWLVKFFNMTYIDAFKLYCKDIETPLVKIEFENQVIKLTKTESIYYLLKKYDDLKWDLINTINNAYFNRKGNIIGKGSFDVIKNEIDLNE